MINSLFKRELSAYPGQKDRDYHVKINGPYYSYRDPASGRREFVFDEELQPDLDDGISPAKAIDRYLGKKYAKASSSSRHQQSSNNSQNHRSQPAFTEQSTLLSPWLENNKATLKKADKLSRQMVKQRQTAEVRSSPSVSKQHSIIEDDGESYEELDDEQTPLVPLNRRRWTLKFDPDDIDSVDNRHGALSIMCMKDDLQKYMAACKQFDVNPSQSFIDQIGAKTVRIKYHTLSALELGPMLHVLAERSTAPVTALDLSCNPLTDKAAGLLAAFLNTSAADCLTYLNLSECMLGLRGGQQILDCVQDNFSIKELYLAANNFSDGIGSCLQNFLSVNDVLKHLDISRNDLAIDASEKIADGLSKNSSLISLNIAWNGVRLKGAEAICGVFALSTITEMDLSWNGVSNDGARAISASLVERGCSLRILNLECNRIGLLGAYALARALRHNRSLKRLDLTMNPITTEGVKALLKAILNNYYTELAQLDIRDIPVEQAFTDLIDQIRRRKTKRSGSEFVVNYGQVVHDPDWYVSTMEAFNRVNDPITILFKYIKEKGFRLLDLFAQFDKDRSSTVSLEEFRNGFISAKIPLSEAQLEYLFGVMDSDGNGEIEYGELLALQQHYRENLRRKLKLARQEEVLSQAEVKLPRIPPNPVDVDAKKNRDRIIKARDEYLRRPNYLRNISTTTTSNSTSKPKLKLPNISETRQGNLLNQRTSNFREALDAERKKLFNSLNIGQVANSSQQTNNTKNQPSNSRPQQQPQQNNRWAAARYADGMS